MNDKIIKTEEEIPEINFELEENKNIEVEEESKLEEVIEKLDDIPDLETLTLDKIEQKIEEKVEKIEKTLDEQQSNTVIENNIKNKTTEETSEKQTKKPRRTRKNIEEKTEIKQQNEQITPLKTENNKKENNVSESPKVTDILKDLKVEIQTQTAPTFIENKEEQKQENTSLSNEIYDPLFDISKIKTNKYQVRQTERTEEEKNNLLEKIRCQGQLEAVILHKENDEYQMIAGFNRYECLKKLGSKTIKAIIKSGLTEEEITKYAYGTNEGRTELTSWDRICSIGLFYKNNPLTPVYDESKKNTICNIFGIGKTVAYDFLKYYDYFQKFPELVALFKKYKYPLHYFAKIYSIRDHIRTKEQIKKLVTILADKPNLSKLRFNHTFIKYMEECQNENKLAEEKSKTDIIMPSNTSKVEIESLKELSDALTKKNEYKLKICEIFSTVKNKAMEAVNELKRIDEIKDYHLFIPVEIVHETIKTWKIVHRILSKLI